MAADPPRAESSRRRPPSHVLHETSSTRRTCQVPGQCPRNEPNIGTAPGQAYTSLDLEGKLDSLNELVRFPPVAAER